MIHTCFIYGLYILGIVKISDDLHEEIRKSSSVMSRSINSQAEFWIKTGMLAELNPSMTFHEIMQYQLKKENVHLEGLCHE